MLLKHTEICRLHERQVQTLEDNISNNCLGTNRRTIIKISIYQLQGRFSLLETKNFQWTIECQLTLAGNQVKMILVCYKKNKMSKYVRV